MAERFGDSVFTLESLEAFLREIEGQQEKPDEEVLKAAQITLRRAAKELITEKLLYSMERRGYRLKPPSKLDQFTVIVAEVDDPFLARVLKGILGLAHEERVQICIEDGAQQPERELEAFERHIGHSKGIIWVPNRDAAKTEAIYSLLQKPENQGIPVVAVERRPRNTRFAQTPVVACDNDLGGWLMGHHIAEKLEEGGSKRYRVFTVGRDRTMGQTDRVQGFRRAIEEWNEAGRGPKLVYGAEEEVWFEPKHSNTFAVMHDELARTLEGSALKEYLQAQRVFAKDGDAVAVFCLADSIALAFLEWMRLQWQKVAEKEEAANRRFPPNLLLAGFDDLFHAKPAGLTTIQQPFEEIGRAALDEALRPKGASRRLQPKLVERESTNWPRQVG